jgi:hypothetical protein
MSEKPIPWTLFDKPCDRVIIVNYKIIGSVLAVSGAALTVIGTIVNSFWLDHITAMGIWMFSNPIMLAWAIGYDRKYWDGGLTGKALISLYLLLTIFNAYGLLLGKIV